MQSLKQQSAMGATSLAVIAISTISLISVSLVSVTTLVAPMACLLERMLLG